MGLENGNRKESFSACCSQSIVRGMIGRTEKLVLIFAALFFSSFCYLYGWLQPANEKFYTGIRSLNASDYNVNLSWIEQFRDGHFLLKNLYTSEPHRGFLVRPIYFLLSTPFTFLPTSNTVVLHLLRLICGFVLLWLLFPFLQAFTKEKEVTRYAFLILAFSAGAGVLLRFFLPDSADLNLPESVLFLTLGEPPHFLYSLLLLWGGIISLYLAGRDPRYLWSFYLCLVLLWWEHPFDAVILAVMAFATLWYLSGIYRWSVGAATVCISIPPALYYRSLMKLPAYAGWSAQNVMSSPSPLSLLSAFVPLILLAIPSVLHFNKDREKRKWLTFLLVWIAVQFLLAYIPVPFQRRLIAGVQFPLAVLAAFTLDRWRKTTRLLPVVLVVLLTSTNIFVTAQETSALQTREMPFYLPLSYKKIFDWMATQEAKPPIFSAFITGNFIPGYTGFPVFIGHSALTPGIKEKRATMLNFFKKPDLVFLQQQNIPLIFWGWEEQRISGPDLSLKFVTVYKEGTILILAAKPLETPHLAEK